MKKLLKNLTLVSTTALLLCVTATTTTIPNIATETEIVEVTETLQAMIKIMKQNSLL